MKLPVLSSTDRILFSEVNYISVSFNTKLNWNFHLDNMISQNPGDIHISEFQK